MVKVLIPCTAPALAYHHMYQLDLHMNPSRKSDVMPVGTEHTRPRQVPNFIFASCPHPLISRPHPSTILNVNGHWMQSLALCEVGTGLYAPTPQPKHALMFLPPGNGL